MKEFFENIFYVYTGTTRILDGHNSEKYLHQTWADLLTLVVSHKLSQNFKNFKKIPFYACQRHEHGQS